MFIIQTAQHRNVTDQIHGALEAPILSVWTIKDLIILIGHLMKKIAKLFTNISGLKMFMNMQSFCTPEKSIAPIMMSPALTK